MRVKGAVLEFRGVHNKVVFQKGGFGGCSPGTKTGTRARSQVTPERKPERGCVRMFPRNENRNEGTFACSPGTKTGTRADSPKPPFCETALLSPDDSFSGDHIEGARSEYLNETFGKVF